MQHTIYILGLAGRVDEHLQDLGVLHGLPEGVHYSVCMYISLSLYIYIYIHTYIHMYVSLSLSLYIYIYIYIYMYEYIHI